MPRVLLQLAGQYIAYLRAYLSAQRVGQLSRIVLHERTIEAAYRARARVALLGSLSRAPRTRDEVNGGFQTRACSVPLTVLHV